MLIGISWQHSEESLTEAAFDNLDSANETKARLTRLRK
jgi:hypothetical protein